MTYFSGQMADRTNINTIKSKESSGKGRATCSSVTSQTKPWQRPFLYSGVSYVKKTNHNIIALVITCLKRPGGFDPN